MMNTVGTPGGYADAFESFMNKDYDLDGNTNTIYNTVTSLSGSSMSSSSMFGSGRSLMFMGGSLEA